MIGSTRVLALVLATAVLGAGCSAPLKPDSARQQESAGTTTPSAAPTPTTTPVPGRSATADPKTPPASSPSSPTPPGIEVPTLTAAPVRPMLGGDISWPQCPRGLGIPEKRSEGLPLPGPDARFVVVGLTNGPGFVANPCLASQVAWARQRHLLVAAYSVISGPTRLSPPGLAGEELGAQQARFNVATMKRVGLRTPMVWLDVESVPHFDWGSDTAANAAVVRGAARAYRAAGYAVGVYSTPYLYKSVVGSLRLGIPEWRAAGQTSRQEAVRRCGSDWVIQGGAAVLGQWVEGGRDRNITCPGLTGLARYFHQY